jgi:anti-anti-sigma regulatory factor
MRMATSAVMLKLDGESVAHGLQAARNKLDGADGELVFDFSSVQRIDPIALSALKELAEAADGKAVKLVLRGVNVDVYKVLKLVKLAARFSFLTGEESR